MTKADKNKEISKALRATKEKRKNQICRVFEVKLDESHFSKGTMKNIERIFLEGKWYRNHAIAQENIREVSDKLDVVQVKVKDKFEDRAIKILSSHMKQSVLAQIKDDIIGLSKKKKRGSKIGKLKFKNRCDSINLKQFGNTYQVKGNKIKIQNIGQWIRVNGLSQVDGHEIANAKLIQKPSGYYLKITCYLDKEIAIEQEKEKEYKLGIFKKPQGGGDFGILNQITFSNGIEVNYGIEVSTKKMKKICRRLSNKDKARVEENQKIRDENKNSKSEKDKKQENKRRTNNYREQNVKLKREYEKTNNQKKDISNKILNVIKTEYDLFGYQNDNLRGWQRIWGRRMLNTAIGGIMTGLKKSSTSVEIDRFAPTTKGCPMCNHKQNITLAERIFKCDQCGYTKPRDWKSAEDIQSRAIKLVGAERIELTPVEMQTSTRRIFERLNAVSRVRASFVVDAGSPVPLGMG